MSASGEQRPTTRPITEEDVAAGFRCGKHALDDYFARHALLNDAAGISKTFVLPRADGDQEPPDVLGYYTLSMTGLESSLAGAVLKQRLPRYPAPVALIGRLAVHEEARGRGLGEFLLMDAFARVLAVSDQIGCVGVVVDAKDEEAELFYDHYAFTTVDATSWPRRMFIPLATVRLAV